MVITPWAGGIIALLLFANVPQMREIYLRTAEDSSEYIRGLFSLVTLCGFSALLYFWSLKMVTRRIDRIYPNHADIYFDREVFRMRDLKAIIIAGLPFLGLAVGLAGAASFAEQSRAHIGEIKDVLGVSNNPGAISTEALMEGLRAVPALLQKFVIIAALTAVVLISVLHRLRNNQRIYVRFQVVCYVLTVALVAIPALSASTAIQASRLAGPLASTCLVLIAGTVFLRFILWFFGEVIRFALSAVSLIIFLLQKTRYAVAILPAVLLGLMYLGLKTTGVPVAKTHTSIYEGFDERNSNNNLKRDNLKASLKDWIGKRNVETAAYPIFIVTAEGGGIYAATAISHFLARMEEQCQGFSEHVFAISAVSGGSIGSALFDATISALKDAGKDESRNGDTSSCLQTVNMGKYTGPLTGVTQTDHLSPVIAYILPDILHDILEPFIGAKEVVNPCSAAGFGHWLGRDQILEKSLAESLSAQVARPCRDTVLGKDFTPAIWDKKIPALVLNSTWVETGYRVAFAPFPLEHLGGGTLYSFGDLLEQAPQPAQVAAGPTVIGAASVSARFPVIMPPWALDGLPGGHRSFVDGGYADASGASTGIELYTEIEEDLERLSLKATQFPLYLIVLSDSYTEDDPAPNSSGIGDFISPVNAILKVRDLLARRAVTQAYAGLRKNKKLIAVQLDQQTFPFALGWTMSRLSSDIIRFTTGEPDLCIEESYLRTAWARHRLKPWQIRIVNRNSCALRRIEDTLKGKNLASIPSAQRDASTVPRPQAPPLNAAIPPALPALKLLGPWQMQ
jgi:hypothetical protein